MAEGVEKKSESVPSSLVKVIALIAAMHTAGAKAFEIPSGTPWEKGHTIIREGVVKDPFETAGLTITYDLGHKKNVTEFIRTQEGKDKEIRVSVSDTIAAIDEKTPRGARVQFACDFHTHNMFRNDYWPQQDTVIFSFPPGREDLNYAIQYPAIVTKHGDVPLYQAAADFMGIWYYRPFTAVEARARGVDVATTEDDPKQEIAHDPTLISWIKLSAFHKSVKDDPVKLAKWRTHMMGSPLADVQKIYEKRGMFVHYVLHDQAQKEVPCARLHKAARRPE